MQQDTKENEVVVVGIGNPYLQDDRAGLVVVERLAQACPHCRTEVAHTAGFEVLDKIRGWRRAIIVDACLLGHVPGSILEVGVDDLFIPQAPVHSHAVTLGLALKTGLLCFPEEMPLDLRIFLIEIKAIKEFTQQMSPEVERAVNRVVERIRVLVGPADKGDSDRLPCHSPRS